MSATDKSWGKFLNPATLRTNLIAISLFITAFETFKASVIAKPESFFCIGFDENGLTISERYRSEVLSLSKSKLYASLLWLLDIEAIEQADIDAFNLVRAHRNELAHEPFAFLATHGRELDLSHFQTLLDLLRKIEKWWFLNVELATDPEMLPDGADPEEVIPGPIWSLQLLLDIALGNEPSEGYYYDGFMRNKA